MQIFLFIAGGGILLLDLLVMGTILFGPVFGITLRGYGIHVFGSVLSAEIALLVLCATCSFSGFLLFILAFRLRRIGLESKKEALRGLDPKLARDDSESKKALRELELKQAARRDTLLNFAAAGLLVLGLLAATVIFLITIGLLPLRGSVSLWLMFMTSTQLGLVAAWLAQQERIDQITLQKQQFWDESRPATRQTRTHRRRARFRWRFLEKQTCYESDTPRWTAAHRRRARFRWHF